MTMPRPPWHTPWLLPFALPCLVACGARTGLGVPDASMDAGPPPALDASEDASIDAPLDAPLPVDAGPPPPDLCVEVPPRAPPTAVQVSFVSRIVSAEVYFLVDVTGSMGDEIGQIRDRLLDTIVPGIAAQIPTVRFSVGRFADYPLDPYGSQGGGGVPRDDVYRLEQSSTDERAAVQRAVERLALQGGGDVPEAAVEALYTSAVGRGPGSLVPPRNCPDGTVGYPCFGADGSRIFLLFTDAPFHNGPDGAEAYGPMLLWRNATYEETTVALRGIGAKVLGLYSGPRVGFGSEGFDHLRRAARDTGAVRVDGSPIVFDIGAGGESLGADVVEAVRTLVEEVPIDVDALTEDVPGDALDATAFVTGVVAVAASPPDGAVVLGDRFGAVRPGTQVTFSIQLANERIERTSEPQVYRMRIVLRGDGVTRLSETLVEVVVPSADGRGCPGA